MRLTTLSPALDHFILWTKKEQALEHSKSSFVFLNYMGVYTYSYKCSILFLWKIVFCAGLLNSLPLVISLFLLLFQRGKCLRQTYLSFLCYNNITGNGSHPKCCWMRIYSKKELTCPGWEWPRCFQWTRLPNYVVFFTPVLKDPFFKLMGFCGTVVAGDLLMESELLAVFWRDCSTCCRRLRISNTLWSSTPL